MLDGEPADTAWRLEVEEKNKPAQSLMLLQYNKKYTVQSNSGSNQLLNDYSTVTSSTAAAVVVVVVV